MNERCPFQRVGFTLTELIAVLAIIVLMVALIVPGVTDMLTRANDVICKNNLRQLGQTSALQARDVVGQPPRFTEAALWVSEVLEDTDGQVSVFHCPDGGQEFPVTVSGPAGNAEEAMRQFLRDYRYRVSALGAWGNTGNRDESVTNIVVRDRWGSNTLYQYFPIDNSYFLRRISDTERTTLITAPLLDAEGNQVMFIGRYNQFPLMVLDDKWNQSDDYTPHYCFKLNYEPDANPYRYWTYGEVCVIPADANFDSAWSDCAYSGTYYGYTGNQATYKMAGVMRVSPEGGKGYTWRAGVSNFPESPNADAAFRITHQDDGVTEVAIRVSRSKLWWAPALVKNGSTPSEDEILVDENQGQALWDAADGDGYEKVYIGEPGAPLQEAVYSVSYGINRNVVDPSELGPRKILIIDYDHLVVDEENPEDVGEWSASTVPFARHSGKVNVLFRNGAVEKMAPDTIDPTVPSLNAKYWQP